MSKLPVRREMRTSNRLGFYQRFSPLATIILLFLVVACFSNVFGNEYVWDDHEFIAENPGIRSLSHIPSFFTESVINLYRPMRTTLYALTYALFKTNPLGYHLVGLGLHLICTLLIYLILLRFSGSLLISFAAAALFGVHPVHVESVTFMTAGFDLLGPLFFLLSFYLFTQKQTPYLSLIFYIFALFSSEMTITLPLVLALYLFTIKQEKWVSLVKKLIPYLVISGFYLLIRFVLLDIGARDSQYLGGSLLTTFLTMTRAALEYLRLLFFPIPLLADYRHTPLISSWKSFSFLIPFVSLGLITFFLFQKRKSKPWLFFGWCWLWITLLPVSNLIPTGNVMAERYLYIPSAALCFALILFLKKFQRFKLALLGIVILLFSVLTFQRNQVWKNELTLWTDTVLTAPKSYVAHNNLAGYYMQKGFINNAYDEIQFALKLKPDFVDAYTNLGALYEKRSFYPEARKAYETALSINPKHPSALSNLGNIYKKMGHKELAIQAYKKSKEINPNFYLADYNLGNILFEEGNLKEAKEKYLSALSIQPNFPNAHFNLSVIYSKEGKLEMAIQEMKKVVKLLPHDLAAKESLKKLMETNVSAFPYASLPQEERQ